MCESGFSVSTRRNLNLNRMATLYSFRRFCIIDGLLALYDVYAPDPSPFRLALL